MIPFAFGTLCGASLACGNLGAAIVFGWLAIATHVACRLGRMAE